MHFRDWVQVTSERFAGSQNLQSCCGSLSISTFQASRWHSKLAFVSEISFPSASLELKARHFAADSSCSTFHALCWHSKLVLSLRMLNVVCFSKRFADTNDSSIFVVDTKGFSSLALKRRFIVVGSMWFLLSKRFVGTQFFTWSVLIPSDLSSSKCFSGTQNQSFRYGFAMNSDFRALRRRSIFARSRRTPSDLLSKRFAGINILHCRCVSPVISAFQALRDT